MAIVVQDPLTEAQVQAISDQQKADLEANNTAQTNAINQNISAIPSGATQSQVQGISDNQQTAIVNAVNAKAVGGDATNANVNSQHTTTRTAVTDAQAALASAIGGISSGGTTINYGGSLQASLFVAGGTSFFWTVSGQTIRLYTQDVNGNVQARQAGTFIGTILKFIGSNASSSYFWTISGSNLHLYTQDVNGNVQARQAGTFAGTII